MLQRFAIADLPLTAWKNGGGSTREIVCSPQRSGLDSFDWRISIATIAQSGPFSVFAGVDRNIMLLQGDGVRLHGASGIDHPHDTAALPFAFPGDVALECTLLGLASTDFNVMTRRGRAQAKVQVHQQCARLTPTASGLLLALQGGWSLSDGSAATEIAEGQGVWWDGSPFAWAIVPHRAPARLVSVEITRPQE